MLYSIVTLVANDMREKIQMMIWWQHSEEPWKVWEYCDIIATGNIRVCVLVSDEFGYYWRKLCQ